MDKTMPLENLDFSVRTWKCLRKAGIDTIGALATKKVDDLLAIPNIGQKSLDEIAGKLQEFGMTLEGYSLDAGTVVYTVDEDSLDKKGSLPSGAFWAEVRNNFFETETDILPEDGDVLARVSIDAWKTEDDNEEGRVIACVMLSKHGDVLVDYRDPVARVDEVAQEAIWEAKEQLRDYFTELEEELEALNDSKSEKVLYFGEGHFVTREALRECAVAAAEDFISKVNKPNGKRDSKLSFVCDFGSPWDELAMYAEYIKDTKSWWTVCSLYTKGEHPDMTAVLSVETTTDVNDIATNILELVEELDTKVEINFVQDVKLKLEELEKVASIDEKLFAAEAKASESKGAQTERSFDL